MQTPLVQYCWVTLNLVTFVNTVLFSNRNCKGSDLRLNTHWCKILSEIKSLLKSSLIKLPTDHRHNMALRATTKDGEEEDDNKKSGISGLQAYWQDANKKPQMEYQRWQDLFEMSLMGKHSIEVEEIIREEGGNPRKKELMGNMEKAIAEKKVISLLFLSIGGAGRKTLIDKYPAMNIKTMELKVLMKNCVNTFQKKRNRCMDRVKFFQRKQKTNETLSQYWNVLNGLAAKGDFGNQTESLVMDVFIANMANEIVQTKLTTEPKDTPEDVLKLRKLTKKE